MRREISCWQIQSNKIRDQIMCLHCVHLLFKLDSLSLKKKEEDFYSEFYLRPTIIPRRRRST